MDGLVPSKVSNIDLNFKIGCARRCFMAAELISIKLNLI
jgi:hypothetical protein